MKQTDLREAMKNAMRAKDSVRLSVIRGLMTAATNEVVSKGGKPTDEMSEEDLEVIIRKASKQRKDSIEQFEKGGRADLAEGEKAELAIIESMLPALMSEDDVRTAATVKAVELGVTEKSQVNQLMGALMKDLKGKADGTVVKTVVDSMFA